MDPSVLGIPWKRQLWNRWKSLRNVPFRKQWFVGYDLEGNSYWEFIDRNNPTRLRRKVSFEKPYYFFGDFKPHPMWMQWLQHTRRESPTLEELVNDMKRQHRMKLLAEKANEKWKSVPLKSQSKETSDPRINSAWTGQNSETVAMETEEQAPPRVEDSQLDEKDRQVREAMLRAEEQIKKAPKILRDLNGTTAGARKKPAATTPYPPPQQSKPATQAHGGSQSRGSPFEQHSQKDEPQTATFKPKPRA